MTDYFALLGEKRRPWLDPEELKEKFHALSAAHHPDIAKDSTVDFAQLNSAYQTLRDPVTRLRHLLELEFPQALTESSAVPSDIADLFMSICQLQQTLQNFRTREAQATTPLARALLAAEKLTLREQVESNLSRLEATQQGCLEDLRKVDSDWLQLAAASRLKEMHSKLAYLSKCSQQLRDDLPVLE